MLNFDFKIILAKMTMFWIISFQFPFNVLILLLGSSTWDTHVPLFHSLVATCGTLCKWLLVCPQLDGPPLLAMVEIHHPLSDVLLWTLLFGSFEKLAQRDVLIISSTSHFQALIWGGQRSPSKLVDGCFMVMYCAKMLVKLW
jgi:hypothetical protein